MRQPILQLVAFVAHAVLVETAKAVELATPIKRRGDEWEAYVFVLAVQLTVTQPVARGRGKPEINLIVEATAFAVGNLCTRGQAPYRIRQRDVVADGVSHVGGQSPQAGDVCNRNRAIARAIAINLNQRAAQPHGQPRHAPTERRRAAPERPIRAQVAIQAKGQVAAVLVSRRARDEMNDAG